MEQARRRLRTNQPQNDRRGSSFAGDQRNFRKRQVENEANADGKGGSVGGIGNSETSSLWYIVPACLMLTVSTFVTWYVFDAIDDLRGEALLPKPIPIVNWSSTSLVDLGTQQNPVILEGTPFDKWPCMKWTLQSLRHSVHADLPVKVSKSPVFKYHTPDKPYIGSAQAATTPKHSNIIMSGDRLFQRLQSATGDDYLYGSGNVELLGLPKEFGPRGDVTFPAADIEDVQVNFWFGSAGVVADWHYDTSDNLHAMISGKKTFLLHPPSAATHLGLYPSISHFYRQARLPYNDTKAIDIAKRARKVTLKPGQVLYIPPYWFHSVETHVSSISVNAWSYSEVFMTMEKIYQLPIPVEGNWPRCRLLYGVWLFVDEVLRQALSAEHRPVFLPQTLANRYQHMVGSRPSEIPGSDELVQCAEEARLGDLLPEVEGQAFKSDITNRVSDHVDGFLSLPEHVRLINVGNFVEHVYSHILHDQTELVPTLLSLRWE